MDSTPTSNALLNPNATTMTDRTLLEKARKARFDDLPKFSGHPSDDVERFLKSVKNMTKANDESNDRTAIEIVRGKLTQSAGAWFDDNESDFNRWSEFETAFRNKYLSTRAIHKKVAELKQRKQSRNEPVTSYLDDVMDLCREIDSTMSDSMIIKYMLSGIIPELQMELSRREASTTTLKEFIKYAKIEQDLFDTFMKPHQLSPDIQQQPYFEGNHFTNPTITAIIKSSNQHHRPKPNERHFNRTSTQESRSQWTSTAQPKENFPRYANRNGNYSKKSTQYQPRTNNRSTNPERFDNCKVCNRRNHRTIDCFHKRANGCFNCGMNHAVRDCTMPPNFQ